MDGQPPKVAVAANPERLKKERRFNMRAQYSLVSFPGANGGFVIFCDAKPIAIFTPFALVCPVSRHGMARGLTHG